MPSTWCPVCCTNHPTDAPCEGDLSATGPDCHGWRVTVETPRGIETYGVLIAESWNVWRARIVTYPKTLWVFSGGGETIRFVGRTPQEAEARAIEFIRAHCHDRSYRIRDEMTEVQTESIDLETAPTGLIQPEGSPAPRKIRLLQVSYGVDGPKERGSTGNLSETGMFITTDSPVAQGQWLEILLGFEDDSVDLRGCVKWMRKQHVVGRSPGMGIQLQDPPPVYLNYVRPLP